MDRKLFDDAVETYCQDCEWAEQCTLNYACPPLIALIKIAEERLKK